ncbi:MAG: transglycosylase SLT domain-containing protein [Gemmatimonadetes bacterium]|nr:transglycosylase SLT domain-containing protein [Gemmatimonadota bacterium]
MQLELQRARALLDLSSRYQVPSDLVALIYDTALREGLDPDLAFRLVKVESYFNPRATSSAQAIGLAQVQLRTARFYQPGITLKRLYDPATNLTIGFRYLHDLIDTYQGDLRLALLAYNRGPAKVNQLLGVGQEPGNGYAASVLSPTASRRR